MFRNRPVGFVVGLLFLAIFTLVAFEMAFATRQAGDRTWGGFIPPGAVAFIYLIWWLKCRNTRLTITRRKAILRKGILSKAMNEVRLVDVRNTLVTQSLLQRLLGVGGIGISTSGQGGIEIEVKGIPNPGRVRDIIDQCRG
jgi:uncharacterized membrane protein YdbT with pleckstrin-like domain